MRIVAGLALALMLALPQAAMAWTARNGLRVNPVDEAVFEVIARGATDAADYWCAASEYANSRLGAAWTTRMYIARTRGPSVTTNRRSAVHFTIYPDRAGITPIDSQVFMNQLTEGDNMSLQQARSHCQLRMIRP